MNYVNMSIICFVDYFGNITPILPAAKSRYFWIPWSGQGIQREGRHSGST